MKIINSIASIYKLCEPLNLQLKNYVDEIIASIKSHYWHYDSRVKTLESFALKIETGRVLDAKKLEDFFACTLVVENHQQIKTAMKKLESHFEFVTIRPNDPYFTTKHSSSFVFDDLRIYSKMKPTSARPKGPINDVIFEIQIKTFLQHAWGLATHDIIYKGDEINWGKERIAFQIKAMLEQAELAISGIENLVTCAEVSKDNKESFRLKKILSFYKKHFDPSVMPADIVRLCKNTNDLLNALPISIADLERVLKNESKVGKGIHTKNLSPYLIIVQSLINQEAAMMTNFLNTVHSPYFKLLITKELDTSRLAITSSLNMVKI